MPGQAKFLPTFLKLSDGLHTLKNIRVIILGLKLKEYPSLPIFSDLSPKPNAGLQIVARSRVSARGPASNGLDTVSSDRLLHLPRVMHSTVHLALGASLP